MDDKDILIERVAARFTEIIRLWLTEQEISSVVAQNDVNQQFCESHAYCDSNQAMIDAYQIESTLEWSVLDSDCALICEKAWLRAKAAKFKLIPSVAIELQLRISLDACRERLGMKPTSAELQADEISTENGYLKEFGRLWVEYAHSDNLHMEPQA